ncbi:CatB-related O-acetyltransferase [Mucilaginibacter sp. OK098]|uniref:CatB-related O-acetyltransferase n=1 Tax=Mucilaginibacter sp. OK098 TaxID=1855297 RepID=UPI0009224E43|nr:CatB-related O-acetyltransferase [Mucilaginibacter sp. OK098]SHN24235.1 Acetyltransferase (isoleucine patch superfamily) [Mucilaginibacter sp. OK098]
MSLNSYLKRILVKLVKKSTPATGNPQPELNYSFHFSTMGLNCAIGKDCYVYNTHIGDYTYLSSNVSVVNTDIGKFCSIAQGACICLGMHPSSKFVSTHPSFFSLSKQNGMTFSDKNYFEEMGKTKIGNDVWIGVNAIILDNVTIGNGVIIGAGAVVTNDIPPYAVAVGVPAKIIRYRFEKDEIEFLEDFKWWNKDETWLKTNFQDLHDIKLFIKKHASDN